MMHDLWNQERAAEQRRRAERVSLIDRWLQIAFAIVVCLFVVLALCVAAYCAGRKWGMW